MTEFDLHPWIEVNNYMREDYRLLVATIAARQIPKAPAELQTIARTAFEKIPVAGARSFFRADVLGQRKALAKTMQSEPLAAELVVALWATAADAQIKLIKQAGEMAGLEFSAEWDWQAGIKGFFDFEEIPVLYALAEKLGEHASAQDADHLKLAALWLGRAVTNPEALVLPEEEEATESQAETIEADAEERG